MMKQNKKIQEIKKKILPVLKANKVKRAGIFGSYARGEQKKDSDVDILVEVQKNWNLLDIIRLQNKIKDVIKNRVDLLEYVELHPLIKEKVLKEEMKII